MDNSLFYENSQNISHRKDYDIPTKLHNQMIGPRSLGKCESIGRLISRHGKWLETNLTVIELEIHTQNMMALVCGDQCIDRLDDILVDTESCQ
uniref:Uncharacterized protein n=1 Tax=Romanomermis culicivorax TaxID=13658 RepID=A0A915ISY3_ROMCU